jgi:hypothetical protein
MLATASIIQKAKGGLIGVELHVKGLRRGRGCGFGRRGCDESERDPQRWGGWRSIGRLPPAKRRQSSKLGSPRRWPLQEITPAWRLSQNEHRGAYRCFFLRRNASSEVLSSTS